MGLAIAAFVVFGVAQGFHGRHLRRQTHRPGWSDRAQLFELVRCGAEIGHARAAQRIDLRHRFADDDAFRTGGELFQGLIRAGIFDVGLIDPNPGGDGRAAENFFELRPRDVPAGGTIGIDEHDQVEAGAKAVFQLLEVELVTPAAGQWQRVHLATNHPVQQVWIFAVSRVQNQRPGIGREPLAESEEDQIGRSASGQETFWRDASNSRNRAHQSLATGRG